MKILVWGINYAPEVSGIAPFNTALCEFLAARGHEVTMLTTFAYYPQWKKSPGDAGRLARTEVVNGVTVARVWHYVPARLSSLKRIVHEATFLALSFLRGLRVPRCDVAVVVSPPLGLGVAAWALSRIKRMPYIFHVQDLQPDAALSLGMLKPSRFTRLLYRIEAFAYRHAARVSGISRGMIRAYERKGVPSEKIVLFPNGVAVPGPEYFPAVGGFRRRVGLSAQTCLATYSGNLGAKQGLDILLDVAQQMSGRDLHIVICGDGARRAAMEEQVAQRQLRNLTLLPLQDDAGYREMQVDTSISLITQIAGTGQFFFPSKLLSAMVFARPVLAVADADSELAQAVVESGCGRVVAPGDVAALVGALDEMSDPAAQHTMGRAGQKWVAQYAFDLVQSDFEKVLLQVAGPSR